MSHAWHNVLLFVQSLSSVQLFVIPWTATHQTSLSFTISQSLLKLMFTEAVMHNVYLVHGKNSIHNSCYYVYQTAFTIMRAVIVILHLIYFNINEYTLLKWHIRQIM